MFCGLSVYEKWITTVNVYFTFKHYFNKSLIMSFTVEVVYTKFCLNEFVLIYCWIPKFSTHINKCKICLPIISCNNIYLLYGVISSLCETNLLAQISPVLHVPDVASRRSQQPMPYTASSSRCSPTAPSSSVFTLNGLESPVPESFPRALKISFCEKIS